MKAYVYEKKRYLIGIILPNVCLMGGLVLFALYDNFFVYRGINLISLVLLIALYTLFNTLVALAYPREIIETKDTLEIHAFGRKHVFPLKEIKKLRIRDLANSRMYVRINDSSFLKGRYWIKSKMYSEGETLNEHLHQIEKSLHPDDLKFSVRTPKKKTR
ncbi:MAG: hypothetical protein ACRCU3_04795 [Eubacteriaceae bacterium]